MTTTVKVVTGYIPLKDHTRTPEEYGKLGEDLRGLKAPVQPFYMNVTATWLYQMIEALPFEPTWSTADNPQKNTLAYMCAINEKVRWLYEASRMDVDSDVFVWLDYGITHCPGVTAAVINDFLVRVKDHGAVEAPGCWPIGRWDDRQPCWRFCGGLLVVPRAHVQLLKNLYQAITMLHVNATKNVVWDNNTLARCEQSGKVPFRWYAADHDRSMFDNY